MRRVYFIILQKDETLSMIYYVLPYECGVPRICCKLRKERNL